MPETNLTEYNEFENFSMYFYNEQPLTGEVNNIDYIVIMELVKGWDILVCCVKVSPQRHVLCGVPVCGY